MTTKQKDWIVVLSSDNQFYCQPKIRPQNDKTGVQHSSFLDGLPVESAGTFKINAGVLTFMKNHSGHYKPATRHLMKMFIILQAKGVNMTNVEIDDADLLKMTEGSRGRGKFTGEEFLEKAKEVINH